MERLSLRDIKQILEFHNQKKQNLDPNFISEPANTFQGSSLCEALSDRP